MTDKELLTIDMKRTLGYWRMNDNSPMSNSDASYSAQVYYQYEATGEFEASQKSIKLWEYQKYKIIDFDNVPEFRITNKTKTHSKSVNVYAVKVLIKQTLTDEKTKQEATNDFDIRIRRNKQKAIIMEKYNSESDKFELVQTEIFINYAEEGERYHKIENLKTNQRGKHSYTVNTYNFSSTDNKLLQSIYVDESSISDFISYHIGKTTLFLLAAIALGLTWYLISALALAMQISLAAIFLIFIAFLIIDEKKNFLPPPKKIFCCLISSEKGDDSPLKKKENKKEDEPKRESEQKSEMENDSDNENNSYEESEVGD